MYPLDEDLDPDKKLGSMSGQGDLLLKIPEVFTDKQVVKM